MKTLTGKKKLPLPFKHDNAHVYHGFLGKSRDETYLGVEIEYELFPKKDVASRSDGYLPSEFDDGDKTKGIRRHINIINKSVGRHSIIKDDGSIDYGIEIASAPATFEKHTRIWDEFFDHKHEYNLRSLSNCGMHVHVSRKGITKTDITRLRAFFAIKETQKFMEKIAGRRQNEYCSYQNEGWNTKYQAINVCPTDTIEFRIFKAPSTKHDFLIRIQLVRALITWVRNRKNLTLNSLKKFISSNKKFAELDRFITKHEL